jgi:hypothetical protein
MPFLGIVADVASMLSALGGAARKLRDIVADKMVADNTVMPLFILFNKFAVYGDFSYRLSTVRRL